MPKVDKWQMTTKTGCRIRTLSVREGATAIIATGEEPDIFCLTEAGIIQSYSVFTACARRATRSRGRVVLQTVMSEDGIGLRITISYSPNHLGVQTTIDVLYGVAELRDSHGVVVSSTEIA